MQPEPDQKLIAAYLDPLAYSDAVQIRHERQRQVKIALVLIVAGILFFVVAGVLGDINNPDTNVSARQGSAFVLVWDLLALGLAPYGLFRLLFFKRYVAKGLRAKLLANNPSLLTYHRDYVEKHPSIWTQLVGK